MQRLTNDSINKLIVLHETRPVHLVHVILLSDCECSGCSCNDVVYLLTMTTYVLLSREVFIP